jgi:putative oxidoreductase
LRRLFSTFADGWPGAGLLFMRAVAGIALLSHGAATLQQGGLPFAPAIREVFAIVIGLLLLAGLWTPIVASLAALLALLNVVTEYGDVWAEILLGTLVVALALLGPGAWSVDARLFGWKRIDVPDRKH